MTRCVMLGLLRVPYKGIFSVPCPDRSVPNPQVFSETQGDSTAPVLCRIESRKEEIIQAINNIDPNSASGPNGFSAILFRNCREELALPLTLIPKKLKTGTVPPLLKEGIIPAIHKGGNKGLPENYRPVTLTPYLIKIIERVVKKKMAEFMEENTSITDQQKKYTGQS